MRRVPAPFFSGRCLLDADLWLPPAETAPPYPVLVACSGYQGLKVIHPERFARTLAPLGYACLAFDYRGFGASEGERGRLVPQEQVEDVLAAVDYALTVPDIDTGRVGLIGWALGGGVAVAAGAEDQRIGAVAAVNAVGDGERTTRLLHDDASWAALLAAIDEDRGVRARTGRSRRVSPWEVLPLDPVTAAYVDDELYKAPGFGSMVTLEAAERLLRFRPQREAARIAPRPLLVVHAADNRLYRLEEAEAIATHAGEGARLEVIEGAGHTEWMYDEHPTYRRLAGILAEFFAGAW
ncbi:MAG: alpha/beta hydrolase [Acidimicrobiales bacterium]